MLSHTAFHITKAATTAMAKKAPTASVATRFMGTLEETPSARSAWEKSCYFEMDFSISEEATVYEAVQKFAAYDIGCLVTTDVKGTSNVVLDG